MRRFFTLFIMLVFSGVLASAQTRTVTGQVRDLQGNPVGFASVTEKGTTNATSTDATGAFTIKVKQAGATTLVVTSSGYDRQEIDAQGSNINVALVRNTQELTTVVVTALGQVRQKASLGYSTATIRSKELTQATPVNLTQGLNGKVAGLTINQTNSGVRGTTRLTLRGIRSLTGSNQPMLILDGVPLALDYLNSINPNDIADVNILKSSSATAIYGPEGVNGAVVVTTKRGTKKPVITFSHAVQLERISFMPKFQSEFGGGYNQDPQTGQGIFEPIEQQSWGDRFDGSIRQFGQTGPNGEKLMLPYSYNPKGRQNFFQTGVTNQTDISYAAGDFYLSAQNVHITGTVPGDVNRRRSITLKAEKEYNKFKAIFNVRYTNTSYDVTGNNTLIYYGVTGAPGNYDLSRFKNWRTDYFSSPDGYYTPYLDNNGKTPYFAKDSRREVGKINDLFGNIELNYKLTNWLSFVYRLGANITDQRVHTSQEAFQRSAFSQTLRDPASQDVTAQVNDQISSGRSSGFDFGNRITQEFFANVNAKSKNFGFAGTLGWSLRNIDGKIVGAGSNNLGFSEFLSIQTRQGEPTVNVVDYKTKLRRYFGRVAIDYKNTLFLEATGSYDADSRLAPPNSNYSTSDLSFFYPGVNASILIHKLIPGMEENKVFNYIKLRGAITKTGNIGSIPAYYNTTSFGLGTFFPYGSILGYQQGTTTFDKLKPEYVKNNEVGLELGFFKNRVNLEATYYHQNNTDQILNIQLSNTTGYSTLIANAGDFTNDGLELDLKLTPLVKIGQLGVDFKVNYSRQTNKIVNLIEGTKELGIGNANYAIVGKPVFTWKLTDYERDAEGHVIVSSTTGMPTPKSELVEYGRTLPTDILGLNLNFNFKGFSLGVTAEYRGGNQILADQLGTFLDDNGISLRSAANNRRAFIFPNSVIETSPGKYSPNTSVYTKNYGRLFYNTDLNTGIQSNYLADGSFWKIREIALSYTLPSRIFSNSHTIKGVTLAVTGRNLFTWLPKSNVWTDPEFSANGNAAYNGNATGRSTAYNLPPTRIFGANVVFTF